jgi:hypothetical protein
MRRLVEHNRPRFIDDLNDALGAVLSRSRQEAFEYKSSCVETAEHQAHDQRGRAGHGAHTKAGRNGGTHKERTRVADAGRASVGEHGNVAPASQQVEHLRCQRVLCVFVGDGQPYPSDARMRQELATVTSVFAADECT